MLGIPRTGETFQILIYVRHWNATEDSHKHPVSRNLYSKLCCLFHQGHESAKVFQEAGNPHAEPLITTRGTGGMEVINFDTS